MKRQEEIEAALCQEVARFQEERLGIKPHSVRVHLIDDLLVIRLQGVLTVAEQQLVKAMPPEKGRDLVKQLRTQLIETVRPDLDGIVQKVTGVEVVSLHHDISTVTGEEVAVLTLAAAG